MPPPRQRRSRALWDATRAPNASRLDLARAVLYEIQPVRFDEIDYSALASRAGAAVRGAAAASMFLVRSTPPAAASLASFLRGRSRREWAVAAAAGAYYHAVRHVHRVLDAGPMMVILTALAAIFTVGLGDGEGADDGGGGVSAYSVFNRGFQRLLGSVDVEALVAQHVGGGLAMQGLAMQRDDGRVGADQNGERELRAAARGGGGGANRDEAAGRNENDEGVVDQQRQRGQNRARRSGKKARRRRNLELRREMQRQRQAAAAMGFAGDGGDAEIAAMNQLIEDQAAGVGADAGNYEMRDEDLDDELQDDRR